MKIRSFFIPFILLLWTTTAYAQAPNGGTAISRPHDPVVLTGAELYPDSDPLIADLSFYRWDGAGWMPIPFQVDEVTSTGVYTTTGSDDDDAGAGLLDDNDEVVLMGYDVGQPASCAEFGELLPGTHDRKIITITDPLNGESGIVSVLNEPLPELSQSDESYFAWDTAAQSVSGSYNSDYVATFGSAQTPPHVALDSLMINDSVDVLDRMKIRLSAEAQPNLFICLPAISVALDEQSAADYFPGGINLDVVGPIRAVGGGQNDLSVAAYGSQLAISLAVDPAALEEQIIASGQPICAGTVKLNYARISFDGNDPATTGMVNYFDGNGQSAVIDGSADNGIANSGIPTWFQISDDGTHGGMVLILDEVDAGTGVVDTYYVDDNSGGVIGDPAPFNTFADSGDLVSYGDTGVIISGSGASPLSFSLKTYLLPPGTSGNVGDVYYEYAKNGLTAAVSSASCEAVTPTPSPTDTPVPATPTTEPVEPTIEPTIEPVEPTIEPTADTPLAVETTQGTESSPTIPSISKGLPYALIGGGMLLVLAILSALLRRR